MCYLEEVKNEAKVSKAGKNYTTCGIKVEGQWRNGFGNKTTQGWQQGMTVKVDLYEEEYNGVMQKKFKTVGKDDEKFAEFQDKLEKLTSRVDAMSKFIKEKFN